MGRSRYKIIEKDKPHFVTCTTVGWTGSFTGADRKQPGFFDEAHAGTLFPDELGELRPSMQVKLLRVLENGEYIPVGGTKDKKADARIISATNQDLPALVRQGLFREDLFYRIHVITIDLPPLRQRRENIPLLVEFFLARFSSDAKNLLLTGKINTWTKVFQYFRNRIF